VTLDLHTQGFLDALGRIDARKEREKHMELEALKTKQLELAKELDNATTKEFMAIAAQLFEVGQAICTRRLEQEAQDNANL
jgi:hypothetical protein